MGSFKLIKPFLNKNKFYLILYALCVCLTYPLESIVIPKIFSYFFEQLKNINSLEENSIFYNFYIKIVVFLVIVGIAQTIVGKLDVHLIPELNESVSNVFFEKILYYYENNYTDLELGKILVRINGLPSVLRDLTTDFFNWILPKLLTVIIINIFHLILHYV